MRMNAGSALATIDLRERGKKTCQEEDLAPE